MQTSLKATMEVCGESGRSGRRCGSYVPAIRPFVLTLCLGYFEESTGNRGLKG
ncbi:MAG: hypothetical protein V3S97_07345 [Candidatus Bathyarchaeia archaeon]